MRVPSYMLAPKELLARRLESDEIDALKALFGYRVAGSRWSEGTIERLREAATEAEAVLHLTHAKMLHELTYGHAIYIQDCFQAAVEVAQ